MIYFRKKLVSPIQRICLYVAKIFVILIGFNLALFGSVTAEPIDAQRKAEIEKIFEEYLLNNPEIVEAALIKLQQIRKDKAELEIRAVIKSNINYIENPSDLYIGGNPDGDVTIVEFFDYNCGYCKQAFAGLNKLVEEDKNIKIVMYEYPILGPSSVTAAKASLAARNQGKYWTFHSALIQAQGRLTDSLIFAKATSVGLDIKRLKQDMSSPEIDAAIANSTGLAQSLNINGTPAFIINGELFPGAIGYDHMLKTIIQARLNK